MKHLLLSMILTAMILFSTAFASEEDPWSLWPHSAVIDIAGRTTEKVIEFELVPKVFDGARQGLGDLRIVDESTGQETAYVLRTVVLEKPLPIKLAGRLFNQTYLPDKYTRVTVDFKKPLMKNRVYILADGKGFMRNKVLIESSDNGKNWNQVAERPHLFRFRCKYNESYCNRERAMYISKNDHRYMRITIYNNKGEKRKIKINNVWARDWTPYVPETEPVAVQKTELSEKSNSNTQIKVDLGNKNLPLYDVKLDFEDEDFFRYANVHHQGSNSRLNSIYRFSSGGGLDEDLSIRLKQSRGQTFVLDIENGDDPPLQFKNLTVTRLVRRVAFFPKTDGPFKLYFGNAAATRPKYDLSHFLDRLENEGVYRANLGSISFKEPPPKEIPFSERYKWLIWVALLAVLLVLGLLVLGQVKSAQGEKK